MKSVGRALIWIPLALLLGHCGSEFLAVDRCLDSGGVFDYTVGKCRSDVEHLPNSPYIVRHWSLVLGVIGMVIAGRIVLAREQPNESRCAFWQGALSWVKRSALTTGRQSMSTGEKPHSKN